ncbi:Phosphoglycerate mutase family protein [Prunus dulcis]|uniref:Phosphoglycerate mutase family protein n=1 Tax=Prunus dulcis TaxID=3755 RepID=A0A4Y1RPK2_PRUDU|nr:Phosphoglycerate mutase family protein [Prunus dulcis]
MKLGDRLSKEPKISLVYSSDLARAYETAQIIAARCGGLKPKRNLEKENVVTDVDLRERHLGDLQGLVFRDTAKLNPKAHQAFVSHETCQEIPPNHKSIPWRNIMELSAMTANLLEVEVYILDCISVILELPTKVDAPVPSLALKREDSEHIRFDIVIKAWMGGGESRDQLHQRCTSSLQRIGNKHKGERVVVVSHGAVIETLDKQASPDGRSVRYVLNASVNIFHVYDDGKWTIKSWGDVSHLNQTGSLQSDFGRDEKSGLRNENASKATQNQELNSRSWRNWSIGWEEICRILLFWILKIIEMLSATSSLPLTKPPQASQSAQLNVDALRPNHPWQRHQCPSRSPIPGPISLSFSLHLNPPFRSKSHSSRLGCVGSDYAEIIVLRHGETAWNADGRIQASFGKFPSVMPFMRLPVLANLGHLDVELNDAGRQQAAVVGDRLSKEPKISVVYSSDLARAYETAQIIAASKCFDALNHITDRHENESCMVVTDVDLRERHLGDLQGLVFRDTAKLNPKAHQAFVSRETCQEIPGGGESRDQLHQRCASSVQRIGNKHKGERVVLVSHGGFIRTLYKQASPDGRSVEKVLNTSVNIIHVYDDGKWTIKSWGDVSHLNPTGYLQSGFGGDEKSG